MHIKDHSAAMKFFRTYDNVASKGKWKEFVDEMEFDSMIQEPRTMAQGGRIGLYKGKLVTIGDKKGQWVIRGVPPSINPAGSIFFPSETAANEWISTRPGKGRKDFGKHVTGAIHKGKIRPENQKKLDKLIEIINDSNNSYKKTITSKDALIKAGWKGGYQAIGTTQAIRPAVVEALSKLNTTYQKIDNYVNNVMLAEDAVMKDFRSPIKHIQKKFGVSMGLTDKWTSSKHYGSKVYADNKALFNGLRNQLSFNKYVNYADGTPRLMSDYSFITQNKMPSSTGWFSGDEPTKFIGETAKRNYLQMKAAGLDPKVTFISDPSITAARDWQFIDNETGRLFSMDPSIDTVEYQGKTYKNNYLQHKDARKLYKKEFGNLYKIYDENLAKYLDADSTFLAKDGTPIKLDTILRRQAFDATGKENFLRRRFMEVDHADLWNDPFGRKTGGLRLIDRRANQQAGLYKRLDKYKNNPDLLNQKLDEIGYNRKFNNTDELITFYSDRAIGKVPKAPRHPGGFIARDLVEGTAKRLGKGALKGARFLSHDMVWPELALGSAEYINKLQKGQRDRAGGETLELMSLGLYDSGATEEAVLEQAKKLGYGEKDIRALENLMRYNKIGKKIRGYEKALKTMGEGAVDIESEMGNFALAEQIKKLKQEQESVAGFYFGAIGDKDVNYGTEIYSDAVTALGNEEFNRTLEDRMTRRDPYAGGIGNWLLNNIFTLDARGRAREQKRIDAMSPQELREFNQQRGVLPVGPTHGAYDHRRFEDLQESLDYMYADGGIASLKKKW